VQVCVCACACVVVVVACALLPKTARCRTPLLSLHTPAHHHHHHTHHTHHHPAPVPAPVPARVPALRTVPGWVVACVQWRKPCKHWRSLRPSPSPPSTPHNSCTGTASTPRSWRRCKPCCSSRLRGWPTPPSVHRSWRGVRGVSRNCANVRHAWMPWRKPEPTTKPQAHAAQAQAQDQDQAPAWMRPWMTTTPARPAGSLCPWRPLLRPLRW